MRSTNAFGTARQRPWRKLQLLALKELIDQIRRRAGSGEHLSPAEWCELDRMRRRLAKLEAEEVI